MFNSFETGRSLDRRLPFDTKVSEICRLEVATVASPAAAINIGSGRHWTLAKRFYFQTQICVSLSKFKVRQTVCLSFYLNVYLAEEPMSFLSSCPLNYSIHSYWNSGIPDAL